MPRARGLSHVDPQNYLAPDDKYDTVVGKRQKHERHELPFHQKFLLHPGTVALVPTLEWIKLPLDIQGVVTARSSWAREALNIATASFVEPGYEGIVTLELTNLGQIPIALYPGLRVAQMALYRVDPAAKLRPGSESQFHMSFEPFEGNIAKNDAPFIPPQ
jgi:dCTP deaminase